MTYTAREAHHFYWHCKTAEAILSSLELNTATRVHLNSTIRYATLNVAGRRGIRLATPSAIEIIDAHGNPEKAKGLIREHVVPISTITQEVIRFHESKEKREWQELLVNFTTEDRDYWSIEYSDSFLRNSAPLSAVIAAIVREKTLIAWVTAADNLLLLKQGLGKSMPKGKEDQHFSRYTDCNLALIDLDTRAPAT